MDKLENLIEEGFDPENVQEEDKETKVEDEIEIFNGVNYQELSQPW